MEDVGRRRRIGLGSGFCTTSAMTASANALQKSLSSGMKVEVATLACLLRRNSGVAGRGRDRTSGGHAGGR